MKTQSEILKLAFIQADVEDYATISTDDFDWTASPTFENRMEALIYRRQNPLWKYVNTVGKKATVIILAICILMGSALSVEAIREPIFDFVILTYEKYSVVFFNKEQTTPAPNTIETKYVLNIVSEGYRLIEIDENDFSRDVLYIDENDDEILFSQCILSDSRFTVNTEGVVLLPLNIGEYTGFYYLNKGVMTLFWETSEYAFRLIVDDDFSLEEAVAIAENMKPENK